MRFSGVSFDFFFKVNGYLRELENSVAAELITYFGKLFRWLRDKSLVNVYGNGRGRPHSTQNVVSSGWQRRSGRKQSGEDFGPRFIHLLQNTEFAYAVRTQGGA